MEDSIDHNRPGPVADGLDSPLSLAILMIGADTRERLWLPLLTTVEKYD